MKTLTFHPYISYAGATFGLICRRQGARTSYISDVLSHALVEVGGGARAEYLVGSVPRTFHKTHAHNNTQKTRRHTHTHTIDSQTHTRRHTYTQKTRRHTYTQKTC